jgi:hypothetical protein
MNIFVVNFGRGHLSEKNRTFERQSITHLSAGFLTHLSENKKNTIAHLNAGIFNPFERIINLNTSSLRQT